MWICDSCHKQRTGPGTSLNGEPVCIKCYHDRKYDFPGNIHIIIGPNGMCRCGEDGLSCIQILRRFGYISGNKIYDMLH